MMMIKITEPDRHLQSLDLWILKSRFKKPELIDQNGGIKLWLSKVVGAKATSVTYLGVQGNEKADKAAKEAARVRTTSLTHIKQQICEEKELQIRHLA